MTETIKFYKEGVISRIELNNPAKHNAIGRNELLAIHSHLSEAENNPALRVLILSSSTGGTFCAGASLEDLKSGAISSNEFQSMTNALAELSIPTIGIGAGQDCDGQVLVLHDMLGITTDFSPRFLRRYLDLEGKITGAVEQYCEDVRSGDFPNQEESY